MGDGSWLMVDGHETDGRSPGTRHPAPVSVLLCTYTRHALLAQALRALLVCKPLPDEVVIVNGGDARADRVVDGLAAETRIPLRLIKTTNKNLAASRNAGLP